MYQSTIDPILLLFPFYPSSTSAYSRLEYKWLDRVSRRNGYKILWSSLDAAPAWMQKGRKRNSQKWQKWELRFQPFCIQTGAASKLIKLESCGWSQMKAYSKSFNFFFSFFIFDHGKVVKVNKEPGSKKSCSKSEMVWWPNTFAVSMRQCHAGCKGWSKRKAEQQSTDAWI